MSGTALVIDAQVKGAEQLTQRLELFANAHSRHELLELMGAEVESQTHRRLRDEKTNPGGEPWPEWSPEYSATRHGGHSLLMGEGDLDDSVQFLVTGDEVEIGSNLVYAAIHQFGGAAVGINIPEREWLGLSGDNIGDLVDVLDHWANQQLRCA